MIDIGVINPVAGGIFVLSIGYMFKQVSNLSRTIEQNKENLQSTRETYVPNTACKEDRNELKNIMKEYRQDTKEFRIEQKETTGRLHIRMDEILTAVRKNGNH